MWRCFRAPLICQSGRDCEIRRKKDQEVVQGWRWGGGAGGRGDDRRAKGVCPGIVGEEVKETAMEGRDSRGGGWG